MTRLLAAIGRIGVYFIPFLFGVLIVLLWFRSAFLTPVDPGNTNPILFEVVKGANIKSISKELEQKGILKHWYSVYYLSKSKVNDSGDLKILAGEYELSAGLRPAQILEILLGGKVVAHDVSFPEGTPLKDLPMILAKSGLVSEQEATAALQDRSLLADLGVPTVSLEGFLFPETYSFSRPVTAQDMIKRMVTEWKNQLDVKLPGWKERASELGLSTIQMMTLASIIEKETGDKSERALISSVFHNRMRIGMKLQSDPTVIYGIKNFNGNLTKEDLKTPTPYNTYIIDGLPPTPICNPGLESIRAAIYPQETDYIYFVGKGDGTHIFSAFYKDHLVAVNRYQKGLGAAPAQR